MNNRLSLLLFPKNIYRLRINRPIAHHRLRRRHLRLKTSLQCRFYFSEVVSASSIYLLCLFNGSQVIRPLGHFQLFLTFLQIHSQCTFLSSLLLQLCPQFFI